MSVGRQPAAQGRHWMGAASSKVPWLVEDMKRLDSSLDMPAIGGLPLILAVFPGSSPHFMPIATLLRELLQVASAVHLNPDSLCAAPSISHSDWHDIVCRALAAGDARV